MDEKHYELAQARTDSAIEDGIAAIKARRSAESATHCIECDAKIPELRRQAAKGTQRCAPCQEVFELKQKHYR